MDFGSFLSDFFAGTAAGAVVLALGYKFVESRLRLRDRGEREAEAEAARARNRESVLRATLGELYSNAAQWETAMEVVPDEGIPYPLFDRQMWNLLSQAEVFTTLKEETVSALMHAYNRMETANEQCAQLLDLTNGPTGLMAMASFAGRMDDPQVADIHKQFQGRRKVTRDSLLVRLGNLKPFLDAAIDAVEEEVGVEARPAAQRQFIGHQGPADPCALGTPRAIVKVDAQAEEAREGE